ncbi:uncharacterized protein LOC131954069 [Physella acuta]|uniref:uncharacterized protein LOC131954069 n=1 Tax=Physella acuta TaxID=109671 RepID=UPI0027DC16FD|nr:uncharacterized protein LOC131954069 [Physella acuta]XP_059173557.1 uncharacterized protein LOC131954069 [Physella acuta]
MFTKKRPPSEPPDKLIKVVKPQLEVDPDPMTMTQILQKLALPRVIQCSREYIPLGANLDFTQPLLAFCRNSVRKVAAVSAIFDQSQNEFTPVGDELLIPETYLGWFAVLGPAATVKSDPTVPFYRNLSYLATSKCTSFLVGGNRSIEGILMDRRDVTKQNTRMQILPGTVLRKGGNYVLNTLKDLKKKKKKKEQAPDEMFMLCFDEYDREIYVPTRQDGAFFIVSQTGMPCKLPILNISQILTRYKFPVIVKLLYGRIPTIPCAFTGALILTDSGMSHTVIASTIFNVHNINLEIPVGSDMMFHVVTHNPGLLGSKVYVNALKSIEINAPAYMRNMKVVVGDPNFDSNEDQTLVKSVDGELPTSAQSSPSGATPSGDQGRQWRKNASTKSRSFKELSTQLTITDIEIDDPLQSARGGRQKPNKLPDIESNMAPFNQYDPPKQATTIPITVAPPAQVNTPVKAPKPNPYEEIDIPTQEKVDRRNPSTDYIGIWTSDTERATSTISIEYKSGRPSPSGWTSPTPSDPGYLVSPKYKEDGVFPFTGSVRERPSDDHRPSIPQRQIRVEKPLLMSQQSFSCTDLSTNPPPPAPHLPHKRAGGSFHQLPARDYVNMGGHVLRRVEDTPAADERPYDIPKLGDSLARGQPYYEQPIILFSEGDQSDSGYVKAGKLTNPDVTAQKTPLRLPVDDGGYVKPGKAIDPDVTFRKTPYRPEAVDSGVYVSEEMLRDENENLTGADDESCHYEHMQDEHQTSRQPSPSTSTTDFSLQESPSSELEKLSLPSPPSPSSTPPPPKPHGIPLPPPKPHGTIRPKLPPRNTAMLKTSWAGKPADASLYKQKLLEELQSSGLGRVKDEFRDLQPEQLTSLSSAEDLSSELSSLFPHLSSVDVKKTMMCFQKTRGLIK